MTVGKHEATVVVKGQTDGASKGLRHLAKELQKTEKQVDKLDDQLAKVTSKDKQKKIQETTKEFEKLSKSAKVDNQSIQSVQNMGGQTRSLLGSVKALRAGYVGLAVAGVGVAINKTRELADESFKLTNVFKNLPFSLNRARDATMGFVDDTALATAAVTAQRFGVVKNAEEFANLTEVATKLAITSGQDASKGIEDLTTALARQSPRILDNLGIVMSLETAHTRYAERIGKTADELTEAEKAEAFRTEAMRAAEKATRNLTVETNSFSAAVKRAEVDASNFKSALLTGGAAGGGGVAARPDDILRRMAQAAGEAAAALHESADVTNEQRAAAQSVVEEYELIRKNLWGSVGTAEDLEQLNRKLANLGAERSLTAGEIRDKVLEQVVGIRRAAEEEQVALQIQRERNLLQKQQQAEADQMLGFIDFSLKLARAEGQSQREIYALQQQRLITQMELNKAKLEEGFISDEQFAKREQELDREQRLLEAQQRAARRNRSRSRARGPSREDEVKRLIDQANAGDRLAQAEAARMEMLRSFHEEDTSLQAERLEMVESLILARERALDIEEARGELSDLARYNREQEILQFQIEAEQLREQMAFDEDARLEAAEARDVLLHDQRLKRIQELPKAIKAAEDAEKEAIAATQAERDRTIGLTKDTMQSLGAVLSNAATARNEDSRAAFVIEKGIKSAELALDAVLYGTKSVSAFAAQNYFQGIAFAAASAASATGAVKMLAQTPESAGAEAGGGGGGGGAPAGPSATPIDRGGAERPGSNIPASPVDNRGGTLPGAGAAAGGGGVSVSIGQFTTLGTVDDETGAKLAQAIERVKEDGLA